MARFADVRAAFVAREKAVTLVADGGLLAEHEAAVAQLSRALGAARTSLADGSAVHELAEQVTNLEARIAASSVTFRFRGLGRTKFRALLAEHPGDDDAAFDRDTFPPALVAACSLDPVMSAADVRDLADAITDGQFDALFGACWDACREVDGVPFSVPASMTLG
jgi:hypothetical protein